MSSKLCRLHAIIFDQYSYCLILLILFTNMNSKKIVRNSSVIILPQQFVTVQIHNSTTKKKFRNHRESIINQMKNTEDLLEETLNKNFRHPKSKFSPNFKVEAPMSSTARGLKSEDNSLIKKGFKLNTQISRKLKQLCNISTHFDQACEYKKKIVPTYQSANEGTYSLPVATPISTPTYAERRVKQEIRQHKTMVRDWKSKVQLGRDFVKRIKLKHPLKFRDINVNAIHQDGPAEDKKDCLALKSFRDIYFSEIRAERKTAPLPSNNLELLCCEHNEKKSTIGYVGNIQHQSAAKVQKFIEGGEQREYNEYSDYLNLNEFKRSKQKYHILNKIYNHVKENNLYEFKDMSIDNFEDKSLLSVAYYIENGNNMTEIEKKNFRKKLKIID